MIHGPVNGKLSSQEGRKLLLDGSAVHNVIISSHATSGMSKTSNMKDHLNQGMSISHNQEIYLKVL